MPSLDLGSVDLGSVRAELVRKPIKHVHLSVHPPLGAVRIAAPPHMALETIRLFAIAKLGWIKEQQRRLRAQEREAPRLHVNRESHQVWGQRRLLRLEWAEAAPCVRLHHKTLVLQLRPGASEAKRAEVLEAWLRQQLRAAVPALLAKWQPLLGVQAAAVYVQRMKTKWGACNPVCRTIRLNTDLARKPPECLEYIVVHELAHLREPHHGEAFQRLMNEVMPQWQAHRRALNRLPLRHEDWGY